MLGKRLDDRGPEPSRSRNGLTIVTPPGRTAPTPRGNPAEKTEDDMFDCIANAAEYHPLASVPSSAQALVAVAGPGPGGTTNYNH